MATARTLDCLLGQLPSELIIKILQCAATEFVHLDRPWVVQLALVSRFVHKLVHPVLYRVMVATLENIRQLGWFSLEDASRHVFRAVRHLHADDFLDNWDDELVRDLLSEVTSIDASLALITTLSKSPAFHPRSLAVRFSWFATFTHDLPSATLASVTHLVGYFQSDYEPMRITPERIETILVDMPALTHIGFEIVDVKYYDDDVSLGGEEDHDEPLDLENLEEALRTILQHPRIQAVAVRVAADWKDSWNAVYALAIELRDVRVLAWHDARTMRSWIQEGDCRASDAWEGKDMWTEAVQVWSPST